MEQLPVVDVNTHDGAVGIFQEGLVANNVHHYKTAARFVAVNAADNRLSGLQFHVHIN